MALRRRYDCRPNESSNGSIVVVIIVVIVVIIPVIYVIPVIIIPVIVIPIIIPVICVIPIIPIIHIIPVVIVIPVVCIIPVIIPIIIIGLHPVYLVLQCRQTGMPVVVVGVVQPVLQLIQRDTVFLCIQQQAADPHTGQVPAVRS